MSKFIRIIKSWTIEDFDKHVEELNKKCRDVASQIRKVLINNNFNYKVKKKGSGRVIINNYGQQNEEIMKVLENNFNIKYKNNPYHKEPDMFINGIDITLL